MNKLIIIGIILGIGIILILSVNALNDIRKQECEADGGAWTGSFSCMIIRADYSDNQKTASDCRMIFGKGTTEMYDCLEKIKNNILTQKPSAIEPERPSDKSSMPPVLISTNGTWYVTIWPNSLLSVEVMCPTDNPYPSNYQILFDKVPYDTKVSGVRDANGIRDHIEYHGFLFDFENPTNEPESAIIQVNCSVMSEPRTEPEPEPEDVLGISQEWLKPLKIWIRKILNSLTFIVKW